MIANKYARMLVPCYLFIGYGIFGSYGQYLMLALLKENIISIYNKHQENIAINYFIIYDNFQHFRHYTLL